MNTLTHRALDPVLCGRPVDLSTGRATVEMETTRAMAADERGLVHGGFLFGLADHAAMLAVNEPTVVLGAANVRFLKPVVVGDVLRALATLDSSPGKKRLADVVVRRGDDVVLTGTFTCLVPERHVLDR